MITMVQLERIEERLNEISTIIDEELCNFEDESICLELDLYYKQLEPEVCNFRKFFLIKNEPLIMQTSSFFAS